MMLHATQSDRLKQTPRTWHREPRVYIGNLVAGGSHDRTDLLPLKAGVAVIALEAHRSSAHRAPWWGGLGVRPREAARFSLVCGGGGGGGGWGWRR